MTSPRRTPPSSSRAASSTASPSTPKEIAKLADLESREVLLGKLAGAMLASLSQAVYLLNAPLAQAARLAGALQAKAEQDPSILAGGAGEPAGRRRGRPPSRRARRRGDRGRRRGRRARHPPPRPSPPTSRRAADASRDHRGLTTGRPHHHLKPGPRDRRGPPNGRKRHHGEAQHRRAARRVQGDDPHRALASS